MGASARGVSRGAAQGGRTAGMAAQGPARPLLSESSSAKGDVGEAYSCSRDRSSGRWLRDSALLVLPPIPTTAYMQ